MSLMKRYKKIREVGLPLNHKMIESYLDHDILYDSARLLGILKGDLFVFDSEDEASVLMDFALHDYKLKGRSAVEVYREKVGGQNEVENEILAALPSAYTSLFEVVAISGNTIILKDLLKKEDRFIRLIDIGFSLTATPGMLIFTRIVPFKDFNMTSGISFLFRGNLKKYLIRRYRRISKKIESNSDSMKRFIAFFKLHRKCGEEVRYMPSWK